MVDKAVWETLWEQACGPIALVDMRARIVEANPAMCHMLGYDRETLLQLRPQDVTHPDDPALDHEEIERMVATGLDSFSEEKRLLRSDGTVIWVLVNNSLARKRDGNPDVIIAQIHDVTSRRESEALWRETMANAPIGMALLDLDGRCTEVNDTFCELVGYRRHELAGQRCTELIYDGDTEPVEALYTDIREERTDAGSVEICLRHRNGHPFWTRVRLGVIRAADNRPAYLISQYELMGDERVSEDRVAQLTRMALHDPLTGLANRTLLIDRFQQDLAELSERDNLLAVVMIDLDGLKPINDRYGHDAGDQALRTVAYELLSAVRSSDTVARIGGDEFVVLANVADYARAEALRARIDQQLNIETAVSGNRVKLGASVGLATTRNPAVTYRDLLASADRDMYARKHSRSY